MNFEIKKTDNIGPEEVSGLLGRLFVGHRNALSYEETKMRLKGSHFIEPASSIFTNIHHSFWDILNEDLQKAPSNMTLAVSLLMDIKERILSLLTPTRKGLEEEIEKMLNVDTMLEKARKGDLGLKAFATGILHILERICTPPLEREIRILLRETDMVKAFKGILRIMDRMKDDMQRYSIKPSRPADDSNDEETIDKIADYIYHLGGDLPVTESWIRKHFKLELTSKQIIYEAFVGLLAAGTEAYPETLMMHIPLLESLKRDYYQLIIAVSIVLTLLTYLPTAICTTGARESSFSMAMNLLSGLKTDSELTRLLPRILQQIRLGATRKLREVNNNSLTESLMKAIEHQINLLPNPDFKVRKSVKSRVDEFLLESLITEGAAPVPEFLSFISPELTELSTRLNAVVVTSIARCMSYYEKIIEVVRKEYSAKWKKPTSLRQDRRQKPSKTTRQPSISHKKYTDYWT